MENVIMMINNAGDFFQLCIEKMQKKTKASQPVKIKAKACAHLCQLLESGFAVICTVMFQVGSLSYWRVDLL